MIIKQQGTFENFIPNLNSALYYMPPKYNTIWPKSCGNGEKYYPITVPYEFMFAVSLARVHNINSSVKDVENLPETFDKVRINSYITDI